MISAIILAAGESKRMGQPKMVLPWGETTVLGQVISTFRVAGIDEIVVVTGGAREQVEKIANQNGVRSVYNAEYINGGMLTSLHHGLEAQTPQVRATLIGLGDQPQIQVGTVQLICKIYEEKKSTLIVPSYQMRRGHPWLVDRSLWSELLAMSPMQSPRDFLHRHAGDILYANVSTPSILADLDTLEDYRKARP